MQSYKFKQHGQINVTNFFVFRVFSVIFAHK